MEYQDRELTCADCGGTFVFTAEQQASFVERGYQEPKRCPDCRAARKAKSEARGSGRRDRSSGERRFSRSGGGSRGESRKLYSVNCAACGKEAQVPFQPDPSRPVYCRDCYRDRGRPSGPGRADDDLD